MDPENEGGGPRRLARFRQPLPRLSGAALPARPRFSSDALPPLPPGQRRQPRKRRRGIHWTLSRYLAAEILRVLFLSVLAISLIGTVVLAFQLVRSGIRLGFLWPILAKSMAYPLFFSLPVALLFGVALGAGRLSGDLEISAMKVNGISHLQLAVPVGALALAFTALAFYLNGEVIPDIHYEKGNLRDAILDQLEDLGAGANRTLLLPRDGRIFVESYRGTRLKGVHLEVNDTIGQRLSQSLRQKVRETQQAMAEGGPRSGPPRYFRANPTLLAEECDLEIASDRSQIILHLRKVWVLIPQSVTHSNRADIFRQTLSIGSIKLALPFLPRGERVKDLSWRGLLDYERELGLKIDALEAEIGGLDDAARSAGAVAVAAVDAEDDAEDEDGEPRRRELDLDNRRHQLAAAERRRAEAATEFWRRGAFSLASLTFPAFGLPLVLLTGRRGRLMPFFLGNVFVVMPFLLFLMLGVLLGEKGISPFFALLAPNLLLGLGAYYLWKKAVRR